MPNLASRFLNLQGVIPYQAIEIQHPHAFSSSTPPGIDDPC